VRPDPGAASRRLFLALWPTPGERRALHAASAAAVAASAGHAVPGPNLHVTLAFLGAVPEGRIARLATLAGQAAADAPAAPLRFSHLEHWRPARLLAALTAEECPAASRLAAKLKGVIAAEGFLPDLKPFRAHVTVARQVPAATDAGTLELPALIWSGATLALVESGGGQSGALYSVLESWLLGKRENMRRES
jgi:RNA 2',3'-cyclic 3'-phosphodiesterase